MNISRGEQRVLHVLAQGGYIAINGPTTAVSSTCSASRDGHVLADCTPEVFAKLRRKHASA